MSMHLCQNLKATFTLKEIVSGAGEECARITGGISNWPKDVGEPAFRCETLYSLSRGIPVKSEHVFESKRRKAVITTTVE